MIQRLPFVTISVFALCSWAAEADGNVAVDAISARQEALQNIEIAYRRHDTFSPLTIVNGRVLGLSDVNGGQDRMPPRRKDGRKAAELSMPVRQPRSWECAFRYLDGNAYYEKRLAESDDEITEPIHEYVIESYAGSRSELASRQTNELIDGGVISAERPLPFEAVIDSALGLRAHGESKWLASDVWKTYEMDRAEDGMVRLERPGPHAGYAAVRTDVWTFDPDLGYALVRYEVLSEGKPTIELRNSDFRAVGQIQLPYRIEWRSAYTRTPEPIETATKLLEIEGYRLGELEDDPGSFLITWPDGAVVYDARTDKQFTVRKGPRKLHDEEVQTYMETGQLPPPPKPSDLRLWITGVSLLVLGTVTAVTLFRRRFAR